MLADLVAFEVVAVKILGEAVRHVHAEASAPWSSQKRSVLMKSARTSGFFQFQSGCSLVNMCRYHWPSGTRVHAGPPKLAIQSVGGWSPFGPLPSRKM